MSFFSTAVAAESLFSGVPAHTPLLLNIPSNKARLAAVGTRPRHGVACLDKDRLFRRLAVVSGSKGMLREVKGAAISSVPAEWQLV